MDAEADGENVTGASPLMLLRECTSCLIHVTDARTQPCVHQQACDFLASSRSRLRCDKFGDSVGRLLLSYLVIHLLAP